MRLDSEVRFAVVPEWVLDAQVSAHAVRLYAVLARYADGARTCYPSRKTVASRMHVSVSTMDRALDELVAIEAVTVTHRHDEEGDLTTSLYTLRVVSPVTVPLVTGEGTVPSPVTQEPEPVKREKKDTRDDPHFQAFWEAYPRRVDKGHARKAWARKVVAENVNPAVVIDAARMYRDQGLEPKFTMHPSTWLNGERWMDEYVQRPEPEMSPLGVEIHP